MRFFKGVNGEASTKRIAFILAVLVAVIGPNLLLILSMITGSEWIGFYQIIIPVIIAAYPAGKFIDGKLGGGP